MPFEPGQLLLVMFPFSDRTAAKLRPVLVISAAKYNRGDDIVVVPLSSRVIAGDQFGIPVLSTEEYFSQTRLRQSSSVKWTKPMVISQRVVDRKLGSIPPEVLKDVRAHVQKLFD